MRLLQEHGHARGCGLAHSERCRRRIKEELRKTDAGRTRVEAAERRKREHTQQLQKGTLKKIKRGMHQRMKLWDEKNLYQTLQIQMSSQTQVRLRGHQ